MRRLGGLCLLAAVAACATSLDKARSARSQGEYTEAESLYRKALDEPKLKKDARQELASMHASRAQDSSDAAKAESLFHRALELDPVHDQALTGLVRLLRRGDRLPEAQTVLQDAASAGQCAACGRLQVVVLLELGDRAFKAKKWDAALKHYEAAQSVRSQPGPAVAIANAHALAGKYTESVAALEAAKSLMAEADQSVLTSFFGVRRYVVEKALAAGDVKLADAARAVNLANEVPEKKLSLALLVADHLFDKEETEGALERYEAMLKKENLGESEREAVSDRVAKIYANRATRHLHAGDGEAADQALHKAIELRPDDWVLKLQRILAISERSGAKVALAGLRKVPKGTVGLAHTRAILLSLRVQELVEGGDNAGAKATLDQAVAADPDLPEVHWATAMVLAETKVEGLGKRERKALLGRRSLVLYDGEVTRLAEALSEIDFVKTELAARKKRSLFAAPWIGNRTKALGKELARRYPHEVRFRAESEPLLILFNDSSLFINVTVNGPEGFFEKTTIAPSDLHEVALPAAGMVGLKIGRNKQVLYAEPFVNMKLALP